MMNNIASREYQIDTMLFLRAPRSVEISFSSNIFLRAWLTPSIQLAIYRQNHRQPVVSVYLTPIIIRGQGRAELRCQSYRHRSS